MVVFYGLFLVDYKIDFFLNYVFVFCIQVIFVDDRFIIADGSNRNQVQAMADSAEEALGRAGYDAKQIEGYQSANWILMDYKDIIVHVFSKEDRAFYDLERIWRDGKQITKEDLQ